MRQAWQTRSRVQDSRLAFREIEHLEMKSGVLSAAFASSSIVANDVAQSTICGTIMRPTPPRS